MVIVRSYADEGKSGLAIENRDGLKTRSQMSRRAKPILTLCLSTMSAGGGDLKMPTKT
jgi:hypothetical protein